MSTIRTGLAKKLVLNYLMNKVGKVIDPSETRAVWFSRKDIEKALKKEGGEEPDGLRFYFAAYESYEEGRPPKYWQDAGKTTLVIVPTRGKNIKGEVVDHPYRKISITEKEKLHFDFLTNPDENPGYGGRDLAETNDGQICPPPASLLPEVE
ncbi:MAG TPA: hypothetical protein VF487_19055 [Chitinophagaceae bacterium]